MVRYPRQRTSRWQESSRYRFHGVLSKVEAQYAPIKSRDKRNEELLSELYRLSRARIRLGLDLKEVLPTILAWAEGR